MREKSPYSEFFWSMFHAFVLNKLRARKTRENTDQKNFEYGHFLHSDFLTSFTNFSWV